MSETTTPPRTHAADRSTPAKPAPAALHELTAAHLIVVAGSGLAREPLEERMDDARATVRRGGYAPRDDAEGRLAGLFVALSEAAVRALMKAGLQGLDAAGLATAAKVAQAAVAVLGALDRRQGRGEPRQTIRIERVTVEPGAQAAIGIVGASAAAGGTAGVGGVHHGNGRRPHEPGPEQGRLAHGPGAPMCRTAQGDREPVPGAGGAGPAGVPQARRRQGQRRP